MEKKVQEYIKTLTEMERITLEIAKKHLGSSFDITKSNGFKDFLKRLLV
jgi:hypothetical protein